MPEICCRISAEAEQLADPQSTARFTHVVALKDRESRLTAANGERYRQLQGRHFSGTTQDAFRAAGELCQPFHGAQKSRVDPGQRGMELGRYEAFLGLGK